MSAEQHQKQQETREVVKGAFSALVRLLACAAAREAAAKAVAHSGEEIDPEDDQ